MRNRIEISDGLLVTLSQFAADHVDAIQELAADREVAATCNLPHPFPKRGAYHLYKNAQAAHVTKIAQTFAVQVNLETAGLCTITRQPFHVERKSRDVHHGQLGYWIGRRFWGLGVMSAAIELLVREAFLNLPYSDLHAHCLSHNVASRRVLEKQGFALVGEDNRLYPKWPRPQPTQYFSLNKKAWLARLAAAPAASTSV